MFTFWLAGAGRVRGSRFFFILLGVAVVGILAVIFFGADSNKRGMPPQANMEAPPPVPPPTPAPAAGTVPTAPPSFDRSEEHTSELQSLMRISYAVFCLKKKT